MKISSFQSLDSGLKIKIFVCLLLGETSEKMLPNSVLIGILITTVIGYLSAAHGEKVNPPKTSYDDEVKTSVHGGWGNNGGNNEFVPNCVAGRCTLPVLQNSNHPPTGMVLILSLYYLLISDFRFWLTNVCHRNALLPKEKQMRDLVLWDIAVETTDRNGCDAGANYTLLTFALDVLAPWFPGGSESCFDTLWVGTLDLVGEGDWVTREDFQADSIAWSMEVGRAFKELYPTTKFNWFITHNTNIDDLSNPDVAAAYKQYLTNLIQGLNSIQKTEQVMWSPQYSSAYPSFSTNEVGEFQTNLADVLTTVKTTAPPGITWINIRDNSEAQHCPSCTAFNRNETTQDTITRYRAMKTILPRWTKLTVSEILGVVAENCVLRNAQLLIPEQVGIEETYGAANVELGPGYELQFWRLRDQNCNILSEGN